MPKTLAELKSEAFGILTGNDPFQAPSTEELETIGMYVDPLVEQLSVDSIVTIPDVEEIQDEYFLPLARLLANVAGPRFGAALNTDAKESDERALRRLSASRPTYETLKSEYF